MKIDLQLTISGEHGEPEIGRLTTVGGETVEDIIENIRHKLSEYVNKWEECKRIAKANKPIDPKTKFKLPRRKP